MEIEVGGNLAWTLVALLIALLIGTLITLPSILQYRLDMANCAAAPR